MYTKNFFQDIAFSCGKVETGKNVAPEIKELDVCFTPDNPSQVPPELGLLGRFLQTPCLFEIYRNPVTLKQLGDCLSKRFDVCQELERQSKRKKEKLRAEDMPRLWILTPTASPRTLEAFSGRMKPDWGEGIYFLAEGLGSAVVVIHQLPETPETLWVRLLGRNGTMKRAIDELEALSEDNPFRAIALKLLYNLSKNLEALPRKSREEQEVIMRLAPLYQQDREKAIQEGRVQGIEQGRQREASLILRLLQRRCGEIPTNWAEVIRELSIEQLEELGEALLDFKGLADLVSWLER